jgi:hypothetical protein
MLMSSMRKSDHLHPLMGRWAARAHHAAAMGRRRRGQPSLAEAVLPAGAGSNRRPERIASLIAGAPLERLFAPPRAPRGGPATRRWRCSARCCWRSSTSPPIPASVRGADPRPSRARLRHAQAPLRLAPRPLPRPVAQRRPSAAALPRQTSAAPDGSPPDGRGAPEAPPPDAETEHKGRFQPCATHPSPDRARFARGS